MSTLKFQPVIPSIVVPSATYLQLARLDPGKSVELYGIVSNVKPHRTGEPTRFHLETSKDTYRCVCAFFCQLHDGDLLRAQFHLEGDDRAVATVTAPPSVSIPSNRDSVIGSFCRALGGTRDFARLHKFYNALGRFVEQQLEEGILSSSLPKHELVVQVLNSWAENRHESGQVSVSTVFEDILREEEMDAILSWWYTYRNLRQLHLLALTDEEIILASESSSERLSCHDIYKRCLRNPYTLGAIPMIKCRDILLREGRSPSNEELFCGEVVRYLWTKLIEDGWTFLPSETLYRIYPAIPAHLPLLIQDYSVLLEDGRIYLEKPYHTEVEVAKYLGERIKQPLFSSCSMGKLDPNLTRDQLEAVEGALNHNITIITGGAGTGKTTVISSIVSCLRKAGIPYALCSFTGKAVSQLRRVTHDHDNTFTMHRMIKSEKRRRVKKTNRDLAGENDEEPRTPFQHLIIDECSMVTTALFKEFFDIFSHQFKITLVGDSNQLPPIGWGAFFQECISSRLIPIFQLVHNHRFHQEADTIILNAMKLIAYNHEQPFVFEEGDSFRIISGDHTTVLNILKGLKENGIQSEDVTIITPYVRELQVLNRGAQELFNGGRDNITSREGVKFMIGDRVMMLINDYNINIMNGDEGIVVGIQRGVTKIRLELSASQLKKVKRYAEQSCSLYVKNGYIICLQSQKGKRSTPTEKRLCKNKLLAGYRSGSVYLRSDLVYAEIPGNSIIVRFEEGEEYSFSLDPLVKIKSSHSSRLGGESGDEEQRGDLRHTGMLTHSFAITCHKGQGSEWKFGVIYIPSNSKPSSFLNGNLVYTMITRFQYGVWCVCEEDVLNSAAITPSTPRQERLAERLQPYS